MTAPENIEQAMAADGDGLTSLERFRRTNAARDAMMGIGIVKDPYPRYHELRSGCPVRGTLSGHFGFEGMDGRMWPGEEHVTVLDYAGLKEVLRDTETFSSSWYDPGLGGSIGRSILHMDPPEHQAQRSIVQGAFSKQEMQWWETEYVRPACHLYIDRFVESGSADLYSEFCMRLPIHVIALALGLPTDDLPWFHDAAVKLTTGGVSPEDAAQAVQDIEAFLRPLVQERRVTPGRDLISVIVHSTVPDDSGNQIGLTDDEILTFCKLLLPAGANTTYRSLGLLLVTLMRDPEYLDRIRADRKLIPDAVDELLRTEHSTSLVGRKCTRDTVLGGQELKKDSVVLLSIAAANHDPDRWVDPEVYDPTREKLPSIAFGWGRHRCLGAHLARMELIVALDVLLDRLPGLRPDPDTSPAEITGMMFRAPDHVRAVWDLPN